MPGNLESLLEHFADCHRPRVPANLLDQAWFERGESLLAAGRRHEAPGIVSKRVQLSTDRDTQTSWSGTRAKGFRAGDQRSLIGRFTHWHAPSPAREIETGASDRCTEGRAPTEWHDMNFIDYFVSSLAVSLIAAGCFSTRSRLSSSLTRTSCSQQGSDALERRKWIRCDSAVRAASSAVPDTRPRYQEARFRLGEAYFGKKEYVTAAGRIRAPGQRFSGRALGGRCAVQGLRIVFHDSSPKPQLDQQYTRAALDHCRLARDVLSRTAIFVPRRRRLASRVAESSWLRRQYLAGDFYFKRGAYDSASCISSPRCATSRRQTSAPARTAAPVRDLHDTRVQGRSRSSKSPSAQGLSGECTRRSAQDADLRIARTRS